MTPLDLVLLPFYTGILYLIFRRWRKKLPNETLKKYHRQAFWVKIFASILFVIYYTYLTGGDSRGLYFKEGFNLYNQILLNFDNLKYVFDKGINIDPNILADPGNIGYFGSEANFMVVRITTILCFLTFGSYAVINLFFGCFALTGLWKMFLFFYEQRPSLHKAFAISVLFFPSVVFWSSGLLKDPLSIGSMGWLTYSLYQLLKGKRILKNTIILFLSVYMLAATKVYILLAYAPLLVLYLLLIKLKVVRITVFKYIVTLCIIVLSIFVFSKTYNSYDDDLDNYAVENLTSTLATNNEVYAAMAKGGKEGTDSNFKLGATFDGTFTGIIKVAPYAIVATFYRPFFWETNKISQLMAAFESIILLFFTLKFLLRAGPFRILKYILSDPLCIFCLLFGLVFGIFVGISTPNFGTLVRYKIPCMPFYSIALFLIQSKITEKAKKKKERQSQVQAIPAFVPANAI